MIVKLVMLGVWMVLVPLGAGYFAVEVGKKKGGETAESLSFLFGLGFILMWDAFKLIAGPRVLAAG